MKFKEKLIKCLKHAFYVFGTTFFSSLALHIGNLTPEIILQCLTQGLITFGSAFFIAYKIVCKEEIVAEAFPKKKKKKGNPISAIILM